MSEGDDIFDEFEFKEEFIFNSKTQREERTGRFFVVSKKTGMPIGTAEPSLEMAKEKARQLLKKRRPPHEPPHEPAPQPKLW